MTDEKGYIQFECVWDYVEWVNYDRLGELIRWRRILHDERLMGVDANGVGYGNLSERIDNTDTFVITATQTGHIRDLDASQFAIVTDNDIHANRIACSGAIRASSESLSHAILYRADDRIGAVVHVHSGETWRRFLGKAPTTRSHAEAGTVAMANEIERLAESIDLGEPTVLVMGGHTDGLLSFGRTVAEAASVMLRACGRSVPKEGASLPAYDG
jgi:ribulose-5-phosphate 4-epimerase/fuculose-1-phosphate aldolase